MTRASELNVTEEEQNKLESWLCRETTEQRFVERARIVLEAAAGKTTKEIAQSLRKRPATVSKWRTRFSRNRLAGLEDAPRPGKAAKYDMTTEKRILAQLDVPPPAGYATWTGKLVAEALERAQGWLRLHDGQAVRGFNHEDCGKVVYQWFLASKYRILC